MRDYYDVLGVPRDADAEAIKKAYRRLALRYHPDRGNGGPAAEERFKEAAEAYGVLSAPDRRAAFDRYGLAGIREAGSHVPDTAEALAIFVRDFGSFAPDHDGLPDPPGNPDPPAEVAATATISLHDALVGARKRIPRPCPDCFGTGGKEGSPAVRCTRCGGSGEVRRVVQGETGHRLLSDTCQDCGGRGVRPLRICPSCRGDGHDPSGATLQITVPPGVEDGELVRVRGAGRPSPTGLPADGLPVRVVIAPDPRFDRNGPDLHTHLSVSFTRATLGGEVEVPTPAGTVPLRIPARSRSGNELRVVGEGMPQRDRHGRGDLIVHLDVAEPTGLGGAEKHLAERLANASRSSGPTLLRLAVIIALVSVVSIAVVLAVYRPSSQVMLRFQPTTPDSVAGSVATDRSPAGAAAADQGSGRTPGAPRPNESSGAAGTESPSPTGPIRASSPPPAAGSPIGSGTTGLLPDRGILLRGAVVAGFLGLLLGFLWWVGGAGVGVVAGLRRWRRSLARRRDEILEPRAHAILTAMGSMVTRLATPSLAGNTAGTDLPRADQLTILREMEKSVNRTVDRLGHPGLSPLDPFPAAPAEPLRRAALKSRAHLELLLILLPVAAGSCYLNAALVDAVLGSAARGPWRMLLLGAALPGGLVLSILALFLGTASYGIGYLHENGYRRTLVKLAPNLLLLGLVALEGLGCAAVVHSYDLAARLGIRPTLFVFYLAVRYSIVFFGFLAPIALAALGYAISFNALEFRAARAGLAGARSLRRYTAELGRLENRIVAARTELTNTGSAPGTTRRQAARSEDQHAAGRTSAADGVSSSRAWATLLLDLLGGLAGVAVAYAVFRGINQTLSEATAAGAVATLMVLGFLVRDAGWGARHSSPMRRLIAGRPTRLAFAVGASLLLVPAVATAGWLTGPALVTNVPLPLAVAFGVALAAALALLAFNLDAALLATGGLGYVLFALVRWAAWGLVILALNALDITLALMTGAVRGVTAAGSRLRGEPIPNVVR